MNNTVSYGNGLHFVIEAFFEMQKSKRHNDMISNPVSHFTPTR